MKCPNCGAEIGTNRVCDSCGSHITYDMLREQEQLNKAGCPKCGSSNITFRRENQGEVRGKKSKRIIHETVGFCKDCGATWTTTSGHATGKRKTWLWVLGWICIFPLPLTILMLRKKDMKPAIKYGIIAVAWIVFLLIGVAGNAGDKGPESATSQSVEETSDAAQSKIEGSADNTKEQRGIGATDGISDSTESEEGIVDLMNGFGTEKIGTITVLHRNQAECTEEAIIDWYFNYVQLHSDCNYHVIVYEDNPTKGIYSNGKSFIQRDVALIEEKNGVYSIGDDAGSTYYTVDTDNKTLVVQAVMAGADLVDEVEKRIDGIIPNEYKGGSLYSVDVAGEEGNLDCNLTLINEMFADADYQSIATELATKIKDLDVGIGYFCISFQSSDSKLNALTSIDNLSMQDVSELSTKSF